MSTLVVADCLGGRCESKTLGDTRSEVAVYLMLKLDCTLLHETLDAFTLTHVADDVANQMVAVGLRERVAMLSLK